MCRAGQAVTTVGLGKCQWLPDDHLAYSMPDVVDQTYLSTIESVFEKETGAKHQSIQA
jgi:hypothetical protein